MRSFSSATSGTAPIILENDEPAAFELINAQGRYPLLLIADHASNRVPRCLQQLGLSEEILASHIAWDAGTADVARQLSKRLDAPLLLSNYSRLVIDCNRAATSPESILLMSDGIQITANQGMSDDHIASRISTVFAPYHAAIAAQLDARKDEHMTMLSIHSFSPSLQGNERPWTIGVCYGDDPRLAHALLPQLSKLTPGLVGDNEPYSIEDDIDYSLPCHARSRGLPHAMLEIRRDKIETPQGAQYFAELIHSAWLNVESSL